MRIARTALIVVGLVLLITFPFGPLFPWSPWKPGYQTFALTRADVVFPAGSSLPQAYFNLDAYIKEAEGFHGLSMPRRMTVVACRDWNDFSRFMPQMRGRVAAAVTLATGTVIYVTPKISEKGLDLREFLRHELSHAAVNQNQTLLNAYRIGRQQWFSEGLAVLFGHQRAYLTASEFVERTRNTSLIPLFSGTPPSDMRYAYQAWRYLLDWQIETRGKDLFERFERACISDPNNCRSAFARTYGVTLDDAVTVFQNAIRSSNFTPAD
jgi:hypothetical protein